MSRIRIRRLGIDLLPDSTRVLIRPFFPGGARRTASVIGRALALNEEEVEREVASLHQGFDARHLDIELAFLEHCARVQRQLPAHRPLSRPRRLLIGALFSGEYALESAALFNPSIVPHPDQAGAPAGGLRFILSLRATGEGHISSIEFRSGAVGPGGTVQLDPVSRFVALPEVVPNPTYLRHSFVLKLREMGFDNDCSHRTMSALGEEFTRTELGDTVALVRRESAPLSHNRRRTLECIQWLADSNYEVRFPENLALSERILFPVTANESNGIEDARFVRFVDDDGSFRYYATYTAYDGHSILPQLIETRDFLHFRMLTLNGNAAQNKGMALFPRRIGGRYAMLSRQDDENLFLMLSDNPHFWSEPQLLLRPAAPWEAVKIGNCGAPIETAAGWLVLTHGVGPMRRYCIGAALLDLDDPRKVLGRLQEPLLAPEEREREGYVPNVVYSCGSLLHDGELILPYAMSDRATTIASVRLEEILAAMRP